MKRASRTAGNRITVLGIDGSGKSTAAQNAALLLSSKYPSRPINVVDSSGTTHIKGGEVVATTHSWIERIKAQEGDQLATVRSALFMVARRKIEIDALGNANELTIGVRDPFRIDPAIHLLHTSRHAARLNPEQRLHLLDRMTIAPHPTHITHLTVDPAEAYVAAARRGTLEPHETPETLSRASREITAMIGAYANSATSIGTIAALRPNTADTLAEHLEPFVDRHL